MAVEDKALEYDTSILIRVTSRTRLVAIFTSDSFGFTR